ncbi:protein trapped in endoderm-1 [Trichonephila clavipes]|nr:protein trapped in endoderm-1 [Trichonephila clavipes]
MFGPKEFVVHVYIKVRSSAIKLLSHSGGENSKRNSRLWPRKREEIRVTFTMLTCFCTFQICFLPLMIMNVFEESIRYPVLHTLASILAWMSACTNSFIYVLLNKHYREAYSQLLCSWKVLNTSRNVSCDGASGVSRTTQLRTVCDDNVKSSQLSISNDNSVIQSESSHPALSQVKLSSSKGTERKLEFSGANAEGVYTQCGYQYVDPGNELPRPTGCCPQSEVLHVFKSGFELGTLRKNGRIIREQASTDGPVFMFCDFFPDLSDESINFVFLWRVPGVIPEFTESIFSSDKLSDVSMKAEVGSGSRNSIRNCAARVFSIEIAEEKGFVAMVLSSSRISGRSQVKPRLPDQSSPPIVTKYIAERKTPLPSFPHQRLSDMGWRADFSPYAQRHTVKHPFLF